MAPLMDARRTLTLGMAALLLLAAVVPQCLMSAAPAMGMPAAPDRAVSSDCGPEGAGSMTACPYGDQDQTPATVSRVDPEHYYSAVSAGLALEPPFASPGVALAPDAAVVPLRLTRSTPLRL